MGDLVVCLICGSEFKKVSNTHLGKHGLTIDEYIKLYPNAEITSDETKCKVSNKLMGHPVCERARNLIRVGHLGKTASDETKLKMSKSRIGINLGVKRSKESIAKTTGWKHSEETKKKLSDIASNRSELVRLNMRDAQLGKKHTDEHKTKISRASKIMWSNPEFKKVNVLKIARATVKKFKDRIF